MFPVALVGASESPSLAYKMFIRLRDAGLEVFPVNPKYKTIENTTCYAQIADIPTLPEVVVFMVNPKVSLAVLQQMSNLGIKKARFQPETFNDEVLAYCEQNSIAYENQTCLLVSAPEHLAAFVNKQ